MKIIVLLIVIVLAIPALFGQSQYVQTIEKIAAQSLKQKALRSQFSADSLAFRRGLNPDDPQISVEYLFDNTTELIVTQAIDFPTVYANRNKISKLSIERAQADFRAANRELMVTISDTYIESFYNARLVELLTARAKGLEEYVNKIEKSVLNGEHTSLDLEAAHTLAAQMHAELLMAIAGQQKNNNMLEQWGYQPKQADLDYPRFATVTQVEFLNAAMSKDLQIEAVRVDSLIAQRTLRLSRSEWIPRFTVGYRYSVDAGEHRNGFVAGISVPLWQNRGNVKQSKAMIKNADAQAAAVKESVKAVIKNLYVAYQASEQALEIYPHDNTRFMELLQKSLSAGTINSADYLLSIIDRYSVQQRLLELEKENVQSRAMIEILMN